MRFAIVSTQSAWGGGEMLAWTLAGELRALGHEVAWLLRGDGALSERFRTTSDTELHRFAGKGRSPVAVAASVRALRRWAPDVVIANDPHAVLLMGAACAFLRGDAPLRLAYKHTDFPLHSRLKYLLCADMIVCVSHAAAAAIARARIPAARYAVIHGAAAIAEIPVTARDDIRAEFGLPSSTRLLVAVANLRAPKGHADLVRALPHLITTHRDWFLVIAGDGPERPHLSRLIAEHGFAAQVHLAGFRTDADQLLAAADLVVHPSRDEGLGLVLIQAQLLRKPLVATAVGGAAEVLDAANPASCTAWIARPEHPEDLARQLRHALDTIAAPPPDFAQRLDATAERMIGTFGIRTAAERLVALVAAHRAPR